MQSISFQIPAVRREEEMQAILTALRALPGVQMATGEPRTRIFTMTWTGPLKPKDIVNTLTPLGYTPDMP